MFLIAKVCNKINQPSFFSVTKQLRIIYFSIRVSQHQIILRSVEFSLFCLIPISLTDHILTQIYHLKQWEVWGLKHRLWKCLRSKQHDCIHKLCRCAHSHRDLCDVSSQLMPQSVRAGVPGSLNSGQHSMSYVDCLAHWNDEIVSSHVLVCRGNGVVESRAKKLFYLTTG